MAVYALRPGTRERREHAKPVKGLERYKYCKVIERRERRGETREIVKATRSVGPHLFILCHFDRKFGHASRRGSN